MFWTLKVSNPTGWKAEKEALAFLKRQGLTLLARNFACKTGEIDLIMLHNETLVFIEVRYRLKSRYGSAEDSITHRKQQKIRHTAALYLQKNRQHNHRTCRFDTLSLNSNDSKGKNRLQWLKGAF